MYISSGKVQNHCVRSHLIEAPDGFVSFLGSIWGPYFRETKRNTFSTKHLAGFRQKVLGTDIHFIVFRGQHGSMCQVESTC